MNPTDPAAYTFGTYPEPRHVRVLRAKVAAVEGLIVKFQTHPSHGGLVPSRQILNAWLEIEEQHL